MKKDFFCGADEGYVSPAMRMMYLETSGVLCMSPESEPDEWKDGSDNWFTPAV